MQAAIIKPIIEQHAEEAAFLWLLRNAAVHEPHYSLVDLAELDDRVEAHLDGLRIAGEAAWEICQEALAIDEPGEVFTAAVFAFEGNDGQGVDEIISIAEKSPDTWQALVSAISWLSDEHYQRWERAMWNAHAPAYQRLALARCVAHNQDPGQHLIRSLADSDPLYQAHALRAVGTLKRFDLLPLLQQQFSAENDSCRFWAAWSAVLLGHGDALEILKTFATPDSRFCEHAMPLILRTMSVSLAVSWLKGFSQKPEAKRLTVVGAGIIGDPLYIPWLIKLMPVPELARVAGESFSMITGLDLPYENLEGEWPEGFDAGPTENPEDEGVDMDVDEDLPWPDPILVDEWWQNNAEYFTAGRRYLVGQPITLEHCQTILAAGFQRQRKAAALELALLQTNAPLFDISAEGRRQQRLLEKS
jgi:uncharacterized protein (TIGR02270 family)